MTEAARIRDRYRAVRSERDRLAHELAGLPGEDAGAVIVELLGEVSGRDAARLLASAVRRAVVVPTALLHRHLADRRARGSAIDAAGISGDAELVPAVRAHLRRRGLGGATALALARMRATSCTPDIVNALPRVGDPLERSRFLAALELMQDPAAVPALRRWLRRAPDAAVPGLHATLRALTGRDPLVGEDAASVRAAWAAVDPTARPEPRLTDVHLLGADRAEASVHDGAGVVAIDHDPPLPGATWPRWGRSLQVAADPVYALGSTCGTCETFVRLAGWPAERAATISASLRGHLAHLPELTGPLLADLGPLLGVLRSGRVLLTLVDLDLVAVTDDAASWFHRRHAMRGSDRDDEDEEDDPEDEGTDGPGTPHFQLRHPIPGDVPTYGSVLPLQPLDRLDEAAVAAHAAAISSGRRPAAVLLAWADDRLVHLDDPERFLLAAVLDGHHKLTAYARAGVPARALLVGRIDDSWGPPQDRTAYLREVTEPLRLHPNGGGAPTA
jgi:hypothetical protein